MPSRRRFLATAGAATVATVAGCMRTTASGTDDYPEGVRFDDGWRSFGHDDANTRYAPDSTPVPESTTAHALPGFLGGVTAASGRVFAGFDDAVAAFDAASGDEVWRAPGVGRVPPTVLDDTVYAPHPTEPVLRGYDAASGDVVASHDLPARAATPPAFSNDRSRLVVALADGRLAGVHRERDDPWVRSVWGHVRSMPALNLDVSVVATDTGEVYAFLADGTPFWRTNLGARDLVAPVVGDERVYVGGFDGTVFALERDTGKVVWERETGFVESALALDGDHLYHGVGGLTAYDPATGDEVWSYSPDAGVRCAPAIVDDTVFVGREDGALAALDGENGDELWTRSLGSWVGHYVAATDGLVVAKGHTDEGRTAAFLVQPS